MQANSQEPQARYDDLPYKSYAYMHSAPEQLAAVASLFGVPSPPVATARVLELGGASGRNLVPFALRNPEAVAVGIDFSGVQVASARDYADRLGVKNVSLQQADFLDLDPDALGKFDYIVAHGVYSWVSADAQEAVLRIIGQCLAPDGVAYVSYNTYPGWKAKEILREAMQMHGGVRPNAEEKVAYGRAMMAFLQKTALKGGLTSGAVNESLAQIMKLPVSYVAHEYLEPFNLPCYFHQFVERIEGHGLAYLGEAQPAMMMPANYSQELAQQLYGALGEDQVRVEKYLDFAISRSFRQTLVIHAERAKTLRWRMEPEVMHTLHYAANLSCADGAIRLDGKPQDFVALPNTASISAGLSALKQAADLLGKAWPGTVTRDELLRHAEAGQQGALDIVPAESVAAAIDELLDSLVLRGMARIRLQPVAAVADSERPVVDPLVRRQIEALVPGEAHVANAWHDTVDIGDVERLLFPLMDGSLDRAGLVEATTRALREGRLPAQAGANPDTQAAELVDAVLRRLRDTALLQRRD